MIEPPSQMPSKRRFIKPSEVPEKAITWRTAAERAQQLDRWRTAVGRHFAGSSRVLRVAWTLEWMFGLKQGYAFCTDGFLERKLDIPIIKIQAALLELERAGAIIRASVFDRNRAQRRIWASSELPATMFPTVGGNTNIPHGGSKTIPHDGGTESSTKESRFSKIRFSATHEAARKDAAIRERAAARRYNGAPDPTNDEE
ncbi:hypothetical protein JQ629_23520 [Bradyrhizobium sp. AUGA SZCCT0222]|uniref:hypothetical protein n=1 Tax=Bradyrhizobium sp. AUGA SZCCT0222 TaxID=2807668 RepID=UPI001BACC13F|nr:hypothetical protein [Bradyrhizobium sp. AUGA SZCCT0222]MBR1270449.1 hypothetical protein [Bradyrhizobium sp. AUGA SZCCT0222]